MEMIIRQYEHYARPLQLLKKLCGVRVCREREMRARVTFHKDCEYYLNEQDQHDINKLFGYSFGHHHKNSLRIGWRYDRDRKQIEVVSYIYIDGVRQTERHLAWCEFEETYDMYIENSEDYANMLVYNFTGICVPFKSRLGVSYPLSLYFGGNNTAPHDMHIDLKII